MLGRWLNDDFEGGLDAIVVSEPIPRLVRPEAEVGSNTSTTVVYDAVIVKVRIPIAIVLSATKLN